MKVPKWQRDHIKELIDSVESEVNTKRNVRIMIAEQNYERILQKEALLLEQMYDLMDDKVAAFIEMAEAKGMIYKDGKLFDGKELE